MNLCFCAALLSAYMALILIKLFLCQSKIIDLVVYSPLLFVNLLLYYLVFLAALQLYRKNAPPKEHIEQATIENLDSKQF